MFMLTSNNRINSNDAEDDLYPPSCSQYCYFLLLHAGENICC